jgi:hypothetical protein
MYAKKFFGRSDRIGFGFFYDRKMAIEQVKFFGFSIIPLVLLMSTNYIIFYRFLYEHPYWEKRVN